MRTAAVVMFFLALAIQASAVDYTVTDLGSDRFFNPMAISDTGYVAGYRRSSENGPNQGFVWHNGLLSDISYQGQETLLRGINNYGQAVGSYYTPYPNPDFGSHGFIWENGTFTPIGTLGGRESEAWDINDAGQVTGRSQTAEDSGHGFLYDSGTMTNLDPNDGWTGSEPWAINQNGDIAGYWHTPTSAQHGFRWSGGSFDDLYDPYVMWSQGSDINDLGWVVGRCGDSACIWRGTDREDLGSLGVKSMAEGINNPGQVVGWCQLYNDSVRAFVWEDGAMSDLNSLIPSGSGWVLGEALAINNSGQIVGGGTLNGQYHGFLLTAVPEPSGMLTLAIGLAIVSYSSFRKKTAESSYPRAW